MKNPYADPASLEFGFRARRFQHVQRLIDQAIRARGTCEILDLGGTETYWQIGGEYLARLRGKVRILLLNMEEVKVADPEIFTFVAGSATDSHLYPGRRFDLVHSNSVIEHVGHWADMQDFAANVRRLGERYFVQTPNYWFPYEPHFRFPGFQYLPEWMRREMLRRFSLGFFQPVPDREEARSIIEHHRLIGQRQMRILFPDAEILFEKAFGLNKSIMAIREAAAT